MLLLAALAAAGCGDDSAGPSRADLPAAPAGLAAGDTGPFVLTADGRAFATAGNVPRALPGRVAPGPRGIAVARRSVWVAAPHTIVRIDPRGARPPVHLHSEAGLVGLAAARRVVWALGADGALIRLDPQRMTRYGTIGAALPNARPIAVAASPGSEWVLDRRGRLLRLNQTGERLRWIGVGRGAVAVSTGGGYVWVARRDGLLLQIRPRRQGWDVRRIRLGGRPADVGFGGGRAWVADSRGRLLAVRPGSGRPAGPPLAVGAGALAVAYDGGAAWVARSAGGRGELLRIRP